MILIYRLFTKDYQLAGKTKPFENAVERYGGDNLRVQIHTPQKSPSTSSLVYVVLMILGGLGQRFIRLKRTCPPLAD
jgi:hypothetical protein